MNAPGQFRLEGLVAAAHTPLHADHGVNVDRVPETVDYLEAGPCRLPLPPLSLQDVTALRSDLDAIGFFRWAAPSAASEVAT